MRTHPRPPPFPLSLRAANLKIWKKDYDRVVALAKGAHRAAVAAPEVQAEALYLLARVHHAKGEMEHAHQFYEKACLRDPGLSPARFGLAQTLIWDESYDEAAAHLRLLLGTCARATDALAALGLLEAKAGRDRREAFGYLRKAIDLDPFNADLVRIEALALQQHEGDYPAALARYRRTVRLLEAQGRTVPADVLTNMGVLCHETRAHGEALEMYGRALAAVEAEAEEGGAGADAPAGEGGEGTFVRHADNELFWKFASTNVRAEAAAGEGGRTLRVVSSAAGMAAVGLRAGDDVSFGKGIEGTVTEVAEGDDGAIRLVLKAAVDLPAPACQLAVKRSNGRLRHPLAVSIAFNLARLHEAAGRTIPAIELHKAILKQHPAYVNSYLRLACIARDSGSLKDCSEWLKNAVAVAPGNPEVLTLVGLEESLPILQTMLHWKEEGRKIAISKGMLTGVVNQCKHNIDSATSHLKEERKKEQDATHLRSLQRLEAEAGKKDVPLVICAAGPPHAFCKTAALPRVVDDVSSRPFVSGA